MKHKTPIQVRFKDIDALGHVNNANHLSYFELARVHYFDDVLGGDIDWNNCGLILARATVDYKMPVLLKDNVFIYTACSNVGNKSFELVYRMVKEENGTETELATGTSVIVCFNYADRKSVPVPADWAAKMRNYDGVATV